MKKILLVASMLFGVCVFSQESQESNILRDLKQRTDKFNAYINFHGSFDADYLENLPPKYRFVGKNLRVDFNGNLTNRIFYNIRHKLNASNAPTSLDNLSDATNFMYAGFKINDKLTLTVGKMPQSWGGYEYDLNPLYVYQYSDFSSHLEIFITGAAIKYDINEKHALAFNVSDVRNARYEERYQAELDPGVQAGSMPLSYIVGWYGNMMDGKLQTRWGVGIQNEAKNYYNTALLLGTKLNLEKLHIYLDYLLEKDQLDRLGYVSTTLARPTKSNLLDPRLKNTTYSTAILNTQYRFSQKWNGFIQLTHETARIKETNFIKDNKRNSAMYQAGIEYFPFQDQDLRFYAMSIGQKVDFNKNVQDYSWARFAIGMMYKIKAF